MFKQPLFILTILVLTTLTFVCLNACAQNRKMPEGEFMSYHFSYGGGMDPLQGEVCYLRKDGETEKRLLTMSGDCPGEEITIEVDMEVMNHCLELIEKHKMYRSKGFYKPKFQVMDAPSSSVNITFSEPYANINGSGDMPDFMWEGISEINSYLKSVLGNLKAEGHVDRIYGIDGIAGLKFTDGKVTVSSDDESLREMKQVLRRMSEPDDTNDRPEQMGYDHFHNGNQHYVLVHDYKYDLCRIFYSYEGDDLKKSEAFTGKTGKKAWEMVNERFLSHPIIDALSDEEVKKTLDNIKVNEGENVGPKRLYTDVGEVNHSLLESELSYREQHRRK